MAAAPPCHSFLRVRFTGIHNFFVDGCGEVRKRNLPHSLCRKMEHAGIIADIEAQLTHAAELVLSGSIAEGLYASVICGALATLPMPRDGTDEWLWAVQLEPESAPMEGFRVSVSGLRQWAAGGWGPVTVS